MGNLGRPAGDMVKRGLRDGKAGRCNRPARRVDHVSRRERLSTTAPRGWNQPQSLEPVSAVFARIRFDSDWRGPAGYRAGRVRLSPQERLRLAPRWEARSNWTPKTQRPARRPPAGHSWSAICATHYTQPSFRGRHPGCPIHPRNGSCWGCCVCLGPRSLRHRDDSLLAPGTPPSRRPHTFGRHPAALQLRQVLRLRWEATWPH
jgi:hypothetical protein